MGEERHQLRSHGRSYSLECEWRRDYGRQWQIQLRVTGTEVFDHYADKDRLGQQCANRDIHNQCGGRAKLDQDIRVCCESHSWNRDGFGGCSSAKCERNPYRRAASPEQNCPYGQQGYL